MVFWSKNHEWRRRPFFSTSITTKKSNSEELSSPPNLFKWQNRVQVKFCRRVHLCCHKLVSKCREFLALLLETLSFVTSRAHGKLVSLPSSLMWDLVEVCTKFSRLFTPEDFEQFPADSLLLKCFPSCICLEFAEVFPCLFLEFLESAWSWLVF